MVGPAAKREAVAHLRSAFEMSERRACAVVAMDRTMIRYRSTRPDDTALRDRLRGLTRSAAGSAIDGYSSCCGETVSRRGSPASTGFTARKG